MAEWRELPAAVQVFRAWPSLERLRREGEQKWYAEELPSTLKAYLAPWRSGYAEVCKTFYTGSIPVGASKIIMAEFGHIEAVNLAKLGHERRRVPFELASGELSHDYIDAKFPISEGRALRQLGEYALQRVSELGVTFTAVGGPTMGADALAVSIAMTGNKKWFSVAKEALPATPEEEWIAGARLGEGDELLFVEDTVSTGGSLVKAIERVRADRRGKLARVAAALTFVDRGELAAERFAARNIPYVALVTYKDIGIEPIRGVSSNL
jgi:orotate phosphoribosyltransferase